MNIFKIESVQVTQETDYRTVWVKAKVFAKVEILCNEHGNQLGRFKLHTEATSYNDVEAMRKTIEKLLNHDYYPEREINMPRCNCSPKFDNIIYQFGDLHEPWRSMFEDLFKDSNWSIVKLIGKRPPELP